MTTTAHAKLTTVATFPEHFFLENLAVRADGSILVTVLNHKQLWYVPVPNGGQPVTPALVHTFDDFAMGIVEAEPDIFYISTAGPAAALERVDMRGWVPGAPVKHTRVLTFDRPAGLNGACLLAPRVILLADSLAGLIWRVDLAEDGLTATASVWLQHHAMDPDPDNGLTSALGPLPGINGIRYAARTNVVYFTCSARKLFMRVAVDQATHMPMGEPEVVADIAADDFCLDENAGVAYLTTHVNNTIVRVPIEPGADAAAPSVVAGDPFTEQLVGPSSAAWARGPADYGRIAYVSTDGGHTAIEYHRVGTDGIIRPARVVRAQFDHDEAAR
jgi:hypothetical protein